MARTARKVITRDVHKTVKNKSGIPYKTGNNGVYPRTGITGDITVGQ